jgi:hypothetical protein
MDGRLRARIVKSHNIVILENKPGVRLPLDDSTENTLAHNVLPHFV